MLNKFMQILCVLLLLCIAIFSIVISVDNILKGATIVFINTNILLCAGLSISMGIILWGLLELREKTKEQKILISTETGSVGISLRALEDFIRKLCLSIEEIKDVRIKIKKCKKDIKINVKLTIVSTNTIPQITEGAKRIIEEEVTNTLGIKENLKIDFYIKKINFQPQSNYNF